MYVLRMLEGCLRERVSRLKWKNIEGLVSNRHQIKLIRTNLKSAELLKTRKRYFERD